jgi:DNA-directed RNA polymerase subunit beta'
MNFGSFDTSFANSINDFDSLRITLISPEKILEKSYGEVKKPETINYRTFRPEKDGLFCPRIFGPTVSNECMCGKYKRNTKYRGIICEKCGVEVTDSFVRRSRIGHIALAAPVVHIWFLKSMPSRIAIILNMPLRSIEMILYHNLYVVVDPGKTIYQVNTLLTEAEFIEINDESSSDGFFGMTGAEAIYKLLADLDLNLLSSQLRDELSETTSDIKKKKIIKRLRLIEQFIESKNRPEWMIVNTIPVLPPDLRPLVMLEAGRFASSDLNDLYRMLINRNNRLRKLLLLSAPDIIIRNEKRMLQEAVDSFFDNSRRGKSAKQAGGKQKRPLKSLSDQLKGKTGRFRQNLLGKRVDYSGRSVIVVGPHLKLHQCGLPKKMAIELFKPHLYRLTELYGMASTLRSAKRFIESGNRSEITDLLNEIVKNHPVLLNRAPTLHRLGIQAFEVLLIDGKAIQLHPLVCTAFNADFDGDQMAVHVPLSIEAQLEAYVLMLSSHNLLNPSNGKPIVMPSKDIVMGLYYMTLSEKKEGMELKLFDNFSEVFYAYKNGFVGLHDAIFFSFKDPLNGAREKIETTVGRVIFYDLIDKKVPFSFANLVLNSKTLSDMVIYIYKNFSRCESADIIDKIKSIGYEYATLSGISCGKNDMVIPTTKKAHIDRSYQDVLKFEQQFEDGLITADEKKNKVIGVWSECSELVFQDMLKNISKNISQDGVSEDISKLNAVYLISNSGARGSPAQIKQLAGMRGLMSKPSGEIIERPILSNFREGLSVIEYFNSTHGARKGLSDTALKTANSGYLTRRLVDVAQDCIIKEEDCGTKDGVTLSSLIDGIEALNEFKESIIGRVCSDKLVNPETGKTILSAGSMIDESNFDQIASIFESVKVRSPITCKLLDGICVKCYGRDLATGYLASVGDAVGVIAAQSIGEPGTQLTMRTFHVGGAASGGAEKASIEAHVDSVVQILNEYCALNEDGQKLVMSRICEVILHDEVHGKVKARHKIPYGSVLYVNEKDFIKKGQPIASWDSYSIPVLSEVDGIVKYNDLEDGISYDEVMDELTGISNKIIVDWRQRLRNVDMKPSILICDKKTGEILRLPNGLNAIYYLSTGASLKVYDGQVIKKGATLAASARELSKTKDITGGLPRVVELFEARKPKEAAILADIDGYIEFGKDYKNKKRVFIKNPENPEESLSEFFINKFQHLIVNEGDHVKRGDVIVDGPMDPHDVLKIFGIDGIARFLITEVQKVYRLQGAPINNKHIEIILKQMLDKVEVIDSCETLYLPGEQFSLRSYDKILKKCFDLKIKPPRVVRLLQGITRSSLESDSCISAASFQETVKVLIDSSIAGKEDNLKGLKENVIVGRLIPAGTGLYARKKKKEVSNIIQEENSDQNFNEEIKMEDNFFDINKKNLSYAQNNIISDSDNLDISYNNFEKNITSSNNESFDLNQQNLIQDLDPHNDYIINNKPRNDESLGSEDEFFEDDLINSDSFDKLFDQKNP